MKFVFLVVALFHLSIVPMAFGQPTPSTEVYFAPQDIELGLMPAKTDPAEGVILTGTVKALAGKLSEVEIRYSSSPDLQVEGPTGSSILATDTPQSLKIKVKPASGKSETGSWVKLHVTYLPDYVALSQVISTDEARYPHPILRGQLLNELVKRHLAKEKSTQVSGYLFPTPPFGGK